MDRVAGYRLVAEELERAKALPRDELLKLVGTEPLRRDITTPAGIAVLETAVTWRDRSVGSLTIAVSLDGPSTYRLERLEERADVVHR